MAEPTSLYPLNPPMGGMCRVPARTPGPMGYLDQGDPNVTSLLGVTPGPLGSWDHGDPSLPMCYVQSPFWLGGLVRMPDGTPLALGSFQPAKPLEEKKPVPKDPKLWAAWSPPAGYEVLFEMLTKNEGNISHLYLDTNNKVTVGIGTCLPTVDDAKKLRFYNRMTQAQATAEEIEADYKAVVDAKPDPKTEPEGKKAEAYESVTQLDMTPTDIGKRWLADVKSFQAILTGLFSGFANYPADAKQALTDFAYQYGPTGATTLAGGKLKEKAEAGDWAGAAELCSSFKVFLDRNAKRKALFESADKAAPKPKAPVPPPPAGGNAPP